MNFFYEAVDGSGRTVLGRLDASSEGEVRQRLLQMGFQPQSVAPNPAGQPSGQSASAQTAPVQERTLLQMPADPARASAVQAHTLAPGPPAVLRSSLPASGPMAQSNASLLPPSLQSRVSDSAPVNATHAVPSVSARSSNTGGIILSGNAARTTGGALKTASSAGSSHSTAGRANVSTLGGVNDRDRLFFFQQLAALVKSGITIYAALDNLAPRTRNANLSKTAHEMAEEARTGGRVSDIMERYPRIYDAHIVGLVRAGETGGFLEIACSEIAHNYETNIALFKGAWIPKLMATQAVYALALVIPLFHDLFNSTNMAANIRLYLLHEAIILPIAFLIIEGVKLGWKRMQLPQFRYFRDNLALKLPPFGDLHRQAALAAFIRMLRRLYHAGVGPIEAWEGAMNTAGNVVIRDRLASSYALMNKGVSLPDAFAATGLFTDNIEQLLMTGQMSGQVVESLDQIADFYQERVDEASKKSKFAMLRIGVLAMLILGGLTMAWGARSYFNGIFDFVDKNFSPDEFVSPF